MAYWLFARPSRRYSPGTTGALVLAAAGAIALVDGFHLAVIEESRARYGQVVSGVVEERLSTTGELGSRTIGGRRRFGRGPTVRTAGFDVYQTLTRAVVTGAFDAWVIDYRYPCAAGSGTCRERDFVPHDLWLRLEAGRTVNVRHSKDETRTARLDENPQLGLAMVKTTLACVLLTLAALISGRLKIFRRLKYVQADAIVTSVEPVKYGDEVRWKVHFAYFDTKGNAQDSVDEVNDPNWKSGDECYAVYSPQSPDVASLHGRRLQPKGRIPDHESLIMNRSPRFKDSEIHDQGFKIRDSRFTTNLSVTLEPPVSDRLPKCAPLASRVDRAHGRYADAGSLHRPGVDLRAQV